MKYKECNKGLIKEMRRSGIHPKYFSSAARFHNEIGTPIQFLYYLFQEWNTFVARKTNSIDINKLSYGEFRDILDEYQRNFPNKIYDDGQVSVGKFISYREIEIFTGNYKLAKKFKQYFKNGYQLYVIRNKISYKVAGFRIIIKMIMGVNKNGKIYYYDLDRDKTGHQNADDFLMKLTPQSLEFINGLRKN